MHLDYTKLIGCSENTRKIVLQLKMIELGFYGLGDGSAGMFLADHYSQVGPYFGNLDEHEWPHSPFVNEPSLLELNLNQKMMEMTDILSHGKLKDVRAADLPEDSQRIPDVGQTCPALLPHECGCIWGAQCARWCQPHR